MKKLGWCLRQSKGIKLIQPNENLSDAYIKEAESTLNTMLKIDDDRWKIITAYYACYNALYAVLMKAGIRCEIHDCTLSLMGICGFDKDNITFLASLKKDRIDAQYYLKEVAFEGSSEVKSFISICKQLLLTDLKCIKDKIIEAEDEN